MIAVPIYVREDVNYNLILFLCVFDSHLRPLLAPTSADGKGPSRYICPVFNCVMQLAKRTGNRTIEVTRPLHIRRPTLRKFLRSPEKT